MQNVNEKEIKAALGVLTAIADAVRVAGSIPSGHLYAAVMGIMDLQTFEKMLKILCDTGLVSCGNDHLVKWIGGDK